MRNLLLCLLVLACAPPGSAAAPPRVGINLSGVTYYDKSYPFIDRMKSADDWSVQGPATEPLALDAQGWPVKLPAGATGLYTVVGVDPPELPTTDRYVLTWKGRADFGFRFMADAVKRSAGRMVIEVRPGSPYLPVDVINLDAAHPLTDLHIVREDQEALFQAGRVFNPAFLEKVAMFDTVRTMDWSRTNTADREATWATRPMPDRVSWSMQKGGGVPLEVQVALANELNRNLWYNIPFQADDDYVTQATRLIRANLKPGLRAYLEYSNEVWNWAFPAATLAAQRGGVMTPKLDNATYYGFRAAQVAKLERAAWGPDPDGRLRIVLATQTSFTGMEQYHIIPGVQRVGDPAKLFDAYAVATYFYGPFDAGSPEWWGKSLAWAKGGDAGLTGFFAYLNSDSLPQLDKALAYQAGVAKKYGWELVAYEGGQHLTASWSADKDDNAAVSTMLDKALADPRMGQVYGRMVAMFGAHGGTMLAAFTEAGKFWGALDTIYTTGSPRYDALVAAAKAGEAKPRPAAGG